MNDEPRHGQTGTTPTGARGTQGAPRGPQGRPGGRGTQVPSRDEVRDTARAASEEAARQYDEAKHAAREKMDETAGQARQYAEQQRESVAGMMDAASRALRNSAGQLDGEDQPTLARYFRWAAESLEDVADNLDGHDTADLWSGLQSYGRRQPGMAFGGAMAAGFMMSRFLKSHEEPYRTTGGYGGSEGSEHERPWTEEPAASPGAYDPTAPGSRPGAPGASAATATPGMGVTGGRPPTVPGEEVRSTTPDPMEPVTLQDEPGKEGR